MFVDLVGSTALSARLDPEEMGSIIRNYQDTVMREFGALKGAWPFIGDGVLAYFGWPVAYEDAARGAVPCRTVPRRRSGGTKNTE